jgi:hypothetical protein
MGQRGELVLERVARPATVLQTLLFPNRTEPSSRLRQYWEVLLRLTYPESAVALALSRENRHRTERATTAGRGDSRE